MAHMLVNHDRRCQFIHGHNYQLAITVEGNVITEKGHPQEGMIIDFTTLKEVVKPVVDQLDHSIVVSGEEPQGIIDNSGRMVDIGVRTTVENIALWLFKKINPEIQALGSTPLYAGLKLHSIEMWETLSSKVTVTSDDL